MNAIKATLLILSVLLFQAILPCNSSAQLIVIPSATAAALTAKLAGPGIIIVSDSLICDNTANGIFVSVATPIALDSGIILCTGHASAASGAEPPLTSTNLGFAGDADLNPYLGTTTSSFDGCALIIHFVPKGDTVSFRYQFGSEEYRQSTCGAYNDAFAFFISGPGISASLPGANMALVPGTNVPVAVNTVNSGTIGTTAGCNIANCTSYGSGSPFTGYFIDNTGGSTISYHGYTTVFTAQHWVIPCDTYRIKMAIVDAGNALYDSGVFIEAGSLKTHTVIFNHFDSTGSTIAGVPHSIVKGCNPAILTLISAPPSLTNNTVHISYGGSAIGGYDYTAPDSVVIPAGDSTAAITITGLLTPPSGTKTIIAYVESPFSCGVYDSITLNLLDSPTAVILTPDTAICQGSLFTIRVTGSTGLNYSWSPAASLSSPSVMEPVASPTISTTYTMTATMPGTTCPPITREITVTIDTTIANILTPDTSVCVGQSVHIRVSGSDSFTYHWTPPATLNDSLLKQPAATPVTTTTYTLFITDPFAGCIITKQITISTVTLTANITNRDTAICRGNSVQVLATGDPSIHYQWIPTAGIASSTILDPLISPDTSAMYYLTGSVPGCNAIIDSIFIDVEPYPSVFIGGNRFVCQFDTIHINASVEPMWYSGYLYSWSPATSLDNTTSAAVVFTAGSSGNYVLTVSTPAGCTGKDSALITVNPGNFIVISPDTSICPHDSAQIRASGGAYYHWHPSFYLSDSESANPWVHAIASQNYTLVSASIMGCTDTAEVNVTVWPEAVMLIADSATIYPGESYQIISRSNCTGFTWFPPSGLNNTSISDPTATPDVSTLYFVTATSDHGCVAIDSISINVSTESILNVPNAFTPGSGANNLFYILKNGSANINYFRIFNRWGELMFETNDIRTGWDGTYKGTPQPFGVYIYEIQAVTTNGKMFTKKGNLTLLR